MFPKKVARRSCSYKPAEIDSRDDSRVVLTGATFSLQNTKYSSCIKQLCQQPEFLEVR